jgi:hypothetical protein
MNKRQNPKIMHALSGKPNWHIFGVEIMPKLKRKEEKTSIEARYIVKVIGKMCNPGQIKSNDA